ncbi:hypothetical protein H0A36_16010 [Endozoicomonas sp. SM1973]|uniref:Uncharacterized protein n=1 Tax=Spartinivicinus marinus TaxID=2994442 RepID=A0A853I291_9GAMM|nr:hypothetical protein [Spartinivicinus marinus]MCX4029807.1 hypothetical protein [Spartinivicinus marinus]NYZ67523.1 hypothetical protein [Spartinivicinus marinus]
MTGPISPQSTTNSISQTTVNNNDDDMLHTDVYRSKTSQRKPIARKGKEKNAAAKSAVPSKLTQAIALGVNQSVTNDEQENSLDNSDLRQQHTGVNTKHLGVNKKHQNKQPGSNKANNTDINQWLITQGIQIEPSHTKAAKRVAKLLHQLYLVETKSGSGLPKVIANLQGITIRLGAVQEKGYENSQAVYNDKTNTMTLNLKKIKASGMSLLQVLVHESLHAVEDLQRTSSASLGDTEAATHKKEIEYGKRLHELGLISKPFVRKLSTDHNKTDHIHPDNVQTVTENQQYQPVAAEPKISPDQLAKWLLPASQPQLYSENGKLYLSARADNGQRVTHYLGSQHSDFLTAVPIGSPVTQFTYNDVDKSYHFTIRQGDVTLPLRLSKNGELFLVADAEGELPTPPPRPRLKQTQQWHNYWDNWNQAQSTLQALLYGKATGDQQAVDGANQAGQNHETRTKEKTPWEAAWERMYKTGSLKNLTLTTGPQDRSRTGSHSTGHRGFVPTVVGWFKGIGNGIGQVLKNLFGSTNPNAQQTLERTISGSAGAFSQHGVQDQLQRLLAIGPPPRAPLPTASEQQKQQYAQQKQQYNQVLITKLFAFIQSMPKGASFSLGAEGGIGIKWPTTAVDGIPSFLGFAAKTGVTGENSIQFIRDNEGKLKATFGAGAGFNGVTLEIGVYGDWNYVKTPFVEGDANLLKVNQQLSTSMHLSEGSLQTLLTKLVNQDTGLNLDWVVQNSENSPQVGKKRQFKPIDWEVLGNFSMGAFGPGLIDTGTTPGVGKSAGIIPGIDLHYEQGVVLHWSANKPFDPDNPDFGLTFQQGKAATYFTDADLDLGASVWGRPAKLMLTDDVSSTIGQANQLFKIADVASHLRDRLGSAKQPETEPTTNKYINIIGIKVSADNLDRVIKKYPELTRFFENDPDAKWRLESTLRHKAQGNTTLNIELRLKKDKFDEAEKLQQALNKLEGVPANNGMPRKEGEIDKLEKQLAGLERKHETLLNKQIDQSSQGGGLDTIKEKVALEKQIKDVKRQISNKYQEVKEKKEALNNILKHRGNFELSGYSLVESRNIQNKRGLNLVFVSVNSTNEMKFEGAILRESTVPGVGVSETTNNTRGVSSIEQNRGRALQLMRNAVADNAGQRQQDFATNSAEVERLRRLVATGQASAQEVESLNHYDEYLARLAQPENMEQTLEKGTLSHHHPDGVSASQAAGDAGEKVAGWAAGPGGAVIMSKYGSGDAPNWIPAYTVTRNKEGVVSVYTAQGKLLKRFNNENGQNQQQINNYLQKLTNAEGDKAKFQVLVTKADFKAKFDQVKATPTGEGNTLPDNYDPANLATTKVQTEFERIKAQEKNNPSESKLTLNKVTHTQNTNEPITKLLDYGRVAVVHGDQITIKTKQPDGDFVLTIYAIQGSEFESLAKDIRQEHQQKTTGTFELKKSQAYALGLKVNGQSITADTQFSGQSSLSWDFDQALLALFHDPENFERNRRLFLQATITAGNEGPLSEAETVFVNKAKQLLQSTSDFDEFLGKAKRWGNKQNQAILAQINDQLATAGNSQPIESITLNEAGEYVVKYRAGNQQGSDQASSGQAGSEQTEGNDKKFTSINELLTNLQSELPDTTKQKIRSLQEQGGLTDFVQKRFESRDKVLKSGWGQRVMSLYSGFGTWNGIRVLGEYGIENDPLAKLQAASTILGAVEEVLSGVADAADLAKRFNLVLPNSGTKALSKLGKLGKAAGPLGIITSAFDLVSGAFGLDAAIRNGDNYEIAASSFDIVGGGLGMAAGFLALNPVTAPAAPFVAVAALLMSAISQGVRAAKAVNDFEKEVRPLSFWEKLEYGAATFFGLGDKTRYPEELRITRMNKAIKERKELVADQEKLVQLVFRMTGDDETSSSSRYPEGSTFLYGQHPRVKQMTEEQLKHANERLRSLGVSDADIKRLTPLMLDTGPKDILTEQRGYGPSQRAVFYNVNDGFNPNETGYQAKQQETDSSSVINTGNRVLAFTYQGRSSDRVVYGFQDKGNTFITTEPTGQRYVGADKEDTVHYMMPSVRPEIATIKNETVRKAVLNMPLNNQEAFASMNANAREALVNAMTAIAEKDNSAQSSGFNWFDALDKHFSQQSSDIAKHFQVVFRGSKRMTTDRVIPGNNWLEKITNGIASLRQATGPDEASMYVYSTYIIPQGFSGTITDDHGWKGGDGFVVYGEDSSQNRVKVNDRNGPWDWAYPDYFGVIVRRSDKQIYAPASAKAKPEVFFLGEEGNDTLVFGFNQAADNHQVNQNTITVRATRGDQAFGSATADGPFIKFAEDAHGSSVIAAETETFVVRGNDKTGKIDINLTTEAGQETITEKLFIIEGAEGQNGEKGLILNTGQGQNNTFQVGEVKGADIRVGNSTTSLIFTNKTSGEVHINNDNMQGNDSPVVDITAWGSVENLTFIANGKALEIHDGMTGRSITVEDGSKVSVHVEDKEGRQLLLDSDKLKTFISGSETVANGVDFAPNGIVYLPVTGSIQQSDSGPELQLRGQGQVVNITRDEPNKPLALTVDQGIKVIMDTHQHGDMFTLKDVNLSDVKIERQGRSFVLKNEAGAVLLKIDNLKGYAGFKVQLDDHLLYFRTTDQGNSFVYTILNKQTGQASAPVAPAESEEYAKPESATLVDKNDPSLPAKVRLIPHQLWQFDNGLYVSPKTGEVFDLQGYRYDHARYDRATNKIIYNTRYDQNIEIALDDVDTTARIAPYEVDIVLGENNKQKWRFPPSLVGDAEQAGFLVDPATWFIYEKPEDESPMKFMYFHYDGARGRHLVVDSGTVPGNMLSNGKTLGLSIGDFHEVLAKSNEQNLERGNLHIPKEKRGHYENRKIHDGYMQWGRVMSNWVPAKYDNVWVPHEDKAPDTYLTEHGYAAGVTDEAAYRKAQILKQFHQDLLTSGKVVSQYVVNKVA